MDKQHHHDGPWILIALGGGILFVFSFFNMAWHEHRIDSAESRIMTLELRIECAASEALFYDTEGNEVCLEQKEGTDE